MPMHRTLNVNFFKKWTSEMAYVLGFFCADGSMIKNKRAAHFIEFGITDRNLLKMIREAFGSNHKIKIRRRNGSISYRLQVGSKEMFNDLLMLGLCPRKSKRISLPKMPKEYFSHFVRGYFDGDGHVVVSKYIRKDRGNRKFTTILSGFTSCSREFLRNLQNGLRQFAHIVGGSLSCNDNYYRLSFSVNDTLALYRFLYKNSDNYFYLERKRRVFEEYFKLGP
jgi:intein-encoded DNA endonuclease-like protein